MKQKIIAFLIALVIFFGTIETIILKLQNIQIVDQTTQTKFFHPFVQTTIEYLGLITAGLVYFLYQAIKGQKEDKMNQLDGRNQAPLYVVIFPVIMDILSGLLANTALNIMASSVWQISKGGNIIFTAILSKIFLKRVFKRSAIFGCLFSFLGITTVQLATVLSSSSNSNGTFQETIGILLMVVSIMCNGADLVLQKWIFTKYRISSFKLVFLEGLYGFVFMIPITLAAQYISCPWSDKTMCANVDGEYYLQSWTNWWRDMSNHMILIVCNVSLLITIAILAPTGVAITKYISPISHELASLCKIPFVWLFGFTMTVTLGVNDPVYVMESTEIWQNVIKLIGFLMMVSGTLLYHQFIPVCRERQPVSESLIQTQEIYQ